MKPKYRTGLFIELTCVKKKSLWHVLCAKQRLKRRVIKKISRPLPLIPSCVCHLDAELTMKFYMTSKHRVIIQFPPDTENEVFASLDPIRMKKVIEGLCEVTINRKELERIALNPLVQRISLP